MQVYPCFWYIQCKYCADIFRIPLVSCLHLSMVKQFGFRYQHFVCINILSWLNPTLETQSTSIHSTICTEWWPRYCSPTYCTGAYNVQAMFKTHNQEREGNASCLNIFRLHTSAFPLCNYACNWHMASYLYCGACCPTATNLLIGAADFLGQTVDHMHTHTCTDKYSLSVSHTQPNASTGEGDVHYSPGCSSSSPI